MVKLGIVMDPMSNIKIKTDSSLAMLLEAQRRKYDIYYMELHDLYLKDGKAFGKTKQLITIKEDQKEWYKFGCNQDMELKNLDIILMRKNPPVSTEYIYATYILEIAEEAGTLIVNKPQSLRDCNEKLYISWFSNFTTATLVSSNSEKLREFHQTYGDVIFKPLDSMGGYSVFRLKEDDYNTSVIIETLTKYGRRFCMAQNYLPDIKYGDKRILVIDGEAVPYCLARIPAKNETRGNLSAGGYGKVIPLSNNDWTIVNAVAPTLKKKGLIFVGLDVIGEYLTEINVTSPTCIREIESIFPNISITGMLFNAIEKRFSTLS